MHFCKLNYSNWIIVLIPKYKGYKVKKYNYIKCINQWKIDQTHIFFSSSFLFALEFYCICAWYNPPLLATEQHYKRSAPKKLKLFYYSTRFSYLVQESHKQIPSYQAATLSSQEQDKFICFYNLCSA